MNLKSKKQALFAVLIAVISFGFFSCKSTKVPPEEIIYNKIIHPREYYFDLSQAEEEISLRKDRKTGLLTGTLDFTYLVKSDIPQAGDKLIFYYNGYTTRDVNGTMIAALAVPMTFSMERPVVSNPRKKKQVSGYFSYVLESNLEKVELTFYIDTVQKKSHINFINEPTDFQLTNLKAESKAEKKATRKKYTIKPVKVPIYDDYSGLPQTMKFPPVQKESEIFIVDAGGQASTESKIEEEAAQPAVEEKTVVPEKTPEQIAEEEAKAKAEQEKLALEKKQEEERLAIEKKKEEERLEFERQQQEMKENQKQLEETIQSITSTNVKRYEKEYLNDYVITEYKLEDQDDTSGNDKLDKITDPNQTDSFNRTMLMKAAQEGNDWQIRALLKANADVNLKDKDGWTALMYAVRYQENMNCVDLLINAGADVMAKNNFGMSALILAANYNNNPEILKKLLNYYSPTDKDVLKSFIFVLTENTASEYMQIIKVNLFLDLSVPLNSFYEGKTPIMYAAESGNSTKVIKLLLDNNSITSIRSTDGKTAFDYAKENPKLKHDSIYWALNNK